MANAFSLSPLTGRESDLIGLAAQGKTDKVIAADLGISVGTVGTYWGRIRQKLRVNSRTEAVAKMISRSATEAQSLAASLAVPRNQFPDLPDPIAICDSNLNVTYTNDAFDVEFEGVVIGSLETVEVNNPASRQIASAVRLTLKTGKVSRILVPRVSVKLERSALRQSGVSAGNSPDFFREYRIFPLPSASGKVMVVIRDFAPHDVLLTQISRNPKIALI